MKKPDADNVNVNLKKARAGRKRRAAGWTLLTLGVIVAGVWAASGWYAVTSIGPNHLLDLGAGRLRLVQNSFKEKTGTALGRHSPYWDWQADPAKRFEGSGVDAWLLSFGRINRPGLSYWSLQIVLWPIPLLLLTAAALLLRSGILAQRRAMTNACPRCGYSLAGLAAGAPCPECGKTKLGT